MFTNISLLILVVEMMSPNNKDKSETPYYPVLIIGAGATGIAAGSQLKQKLGLNEFKIVDRQSGIGGESEEEISSLQLLMVSGRNLVDQPIPRSSKSYRTR